MTINLLQTPEYKALIKKHIEETIVYFFKQDQEFAIACDMQHVSFSPALPQSITETFKETVLFLVMNYSFESAKIEDNYFSFEAGFGSENFGATVTMPLLAIKQVFLGDHPVVFNLAHPEIPKKKIVKNSMETLLNNPENKKLLKKRVPKPS